MDLYHLPKKRAELVRCFYTAFSAFSYGDYFKVYDKKTRFLNLGFSLLMFVMAQAYVAQLTATFIAADQPVPQINSLEDAISQGAVLCAQVSTTSSTWMQANYPQIPLILSPLSKIFDNLNNGVCQGAVTYRGNQYIKFG